MSELAVRQRKAGGFPGEIPVGRIRRAVEEFITESDGAETWSAVAIRAGYCHQRDGRTVADVSSLKRRLGMIPTTWIKAKHRGEGPCLSKRSKKMRYSTALRIAEAIGRDPWELGL